MVLTIKQIRRIISEQILEDDPHIFNWQGKDDKIPVPKTIWSHDINGVINQDGVIQALGTWAVGTNNHFKAMMESYKNAVEKISDWKEKNNILPVDRPKPRVVKRSTVDGIVYTVVEAQIPSLAKEDIRITLDNIGQLIREEATEMSVMNRLQKIIPLKNVPRGRPWADPSDNRYIPGAIGWITQSDVDNLGGGQPESLLKITSDGVGREITYTVVRWGGASGDLSPTPKTHVDYVIHFDDTNRGPTQ